MEGQEPLPDSFYKAKIVLVLKQKRHCKKENYRQTYLMNMDVKTLNKILTNRI
jgi:hypothetical protein